MLTPSRLNRPASRFSPFAGGKNVSSSKGRLSSSFLSGHKRSSLGLSQSHQVFSNEVFLSMEVDLPVKNLADSCDLCSDLMFCLCSVLPAIKSSRQVEYIDVCAGATMNFNQSFNRSLQTSRIIQESDQYQLETYGGALPVSVTEVLTLTQGGKASVKLDPSGWAWLVCDTRLLVWQYKGSLYGKSSNCKELNLSPNTAWHSAELVTVLPHPGSSSIAACIAVSPDGAVRYWPNITHEGSYQEIVVDLKDEECAAVINLDHFQCVLASSTTTLVLLLPSLAQLEIRARTLRAPQGRLAGIGRRMSSLIFGSVTTQAIGAPLGRIVAGENLDETTPTFYVLAGANLQKWALHGENETLLYQCNVESLFSSCMAETIWEQDVHHLTGLKTWLLDMQAAKDGLVFLGAGVNPDVSGDIHFALGTLHTEGRDPPQSFLSFAVPQYTILYEEESVKDDLAYCLLVPNPSLPSAYMYNKSTCLRTSVSGSNQPVQKVDFRDQLLGAGVCEQIALFFTSTHGILSMRETCMDESTSQFGFEPTITQFEASLTSGIDELSMKEDENSRMKTAFLNYSRGNVGQAQGLIDELFPPDVPITADGSSHLDALVLSLSQQMVDDIPASDPRWAESVPQDGVSRSSSLILLHQLDDKLKVQEQYYIPFLKTIGVWPRLSISMVRQTKMPSRMLLCEHAEKIVAAKKMDELQMQFGDLIQEGIKRALEARAAALIPGIPLQDLFYREISKIGDILEGIISFEETYLASDMSSRDLVKLISSVNNIFVGMLCEACQYRESKVLLYHSAQTVVEGTEFLPWTASSGPKGNRALLLWQHQLTVERGLSDAKDTQERGTLFQQLVELTDLVLDGYRTQLESLSQASGASPRYQEVLREYEQNRASLISPFMHHKQYERAASLAEKYCDFPTLVRLCDETGNEKRLERYLDQFQNRGFAEVVFRWYVKEGKRAKLMTSKPLANHPQLRRFLQTEDKSLIWLHDILNKDFLGAHKNLFELAQEEKSSLSKKKTLLSLGKLAALASEDPPDSVDTNLETINEELELIQHQEQLPEEVVESLGMSRDDMNVIGPDDLIQLYVNDVNTCANEFDIKKALDLLYYIDKNDPECLYENLLLHIWCKVLLRDNWAEISTERPIENCKKTLFFRTVDLAYTSGMDLLLIMPAEEKLLTCEELGPLKDDTNFQFLVRSCYEEIQRILS